MSPDQKEFLELAKAAVKVADPTALPTIAAYREEDFDGVVEAVLRFALANGLTPLEALPHVENFL